jgi:hypothetical protein
MPIQTDLYRAKVVLVGGHALVREHLSALIEAESDMAVPV